MKLWDDIRNYFYKKNLAEKTAALKTQRSVINWDDAKSIGIIYDSTNPDNDIIITKFAEILRHEGKTVDILGYLHDKKIDHKADIQIFNIKALNWARVPQDEKTAAFVKKNFDLLLCCFTDEHLPLEYIAATSNARWRMGVYNQAKTGYYDMMINMGGKTDLQYLLDQSVSFLKQIKYN